MGDFQISIGRAKLNFGGVKAVLNDSAVVAECMARGAAIAAKANDLTAEQYPDGGYKSDAYVSHDTTTRYGNKACVVITNNRLGRYAQAHHSVLTSAMDAGR